MSAEVRFSEFGRATKHALSVLSEAEEYGRRGNESSTRHLAERMEKLAARAPRVEAGAPRAMGHGRKGASGCRGDPAGFVLSCFRWIRWIPSINMLN
jgi:hypothetical protein